jgi:hypothetical protein
MTRFDIGCYYFYRFFAVRENIFGRHVLLACSIARILSRRSLSGSCLSCAVALNERTNLFDRLLTVIKVNTATSGRTTRNQINFFILATLKAWKRKQGFVD